MNLILKNLEQACVTYMLLDATSDDELRQTARVFRLEWKDAHQYRQWADRKEVLEGYIYPFEKDKYPNVQLTTVNTEGDMEVRYYNLARDRVNWWIAQADAMFPLGNEAPGRPISRVLEAITSRQRRTLPRRRTLV